MGCTTLNDSNIYFQGTLDYFVSFNPSAGQIQISTWYHLACTHNNSTAKVYINGQLEGSQAQGGAITSSIYRVTFGKVSATNYSDKYYDGLMDEILIYNRAITEAEIQALYQMESDKKLIGDVDGNGVMDLDDAILALQVSIGIVPTTTIYLEADVNGDGKIGLAEAFYAMQVVSGMR